MTDPYSSAEPERSEMPAPGDQETTSARVITIRPVHFVVAVLAVFAFAGGVWLAQARAVPPPSAAAPAAPTASLAQQPFLIQPQQQALGEINEGVVMELDNFHPLLGKPYIEIEGADLAGQPAKLSDYLGKPVMLNFWATWCPPCRVEMPWMEEVYQEFRDQGFVILAVDAGERVPAEAVGATVSSYIQGSGLTFPVLLPNDPYTPQLEYIVGGLPSTYMIDPEGTIVDVHRGMYPNRATLRDRVVKLLEAGDA